MIRAEKESLGLLNAAGVAARALLGLAALLLALPAGAACLPVRDKVTVLEGNDATISIACNQGERFRSLDWFKNGVSDSGGTGFTVPVGDLSVFHYRMRGNLPPGIYRYRLAGVSADGSKMISSTEIALAVIRKGETLSDPGGSWSPPGYPGLLVADQMGQDGAGSFDYLPGCLNHEPTPTHPSTGCAAEDRYGWTASDGSLETFVFGPGRVLSLRMLGFDDGVAGNGEFRLQGADGGNLGSSVSLWVVEDPRIPYDETQVGCRETSDTVVTVRTWEHTCPLIRGHRYYVNIKVNDAKNCGLPTACRMTLRESVDSF